MSPPGPAAPTTSRRGWRGGVDRAPHVVVAGLAATWIAALAVEGGLGTGPMYLVFLGLVATAFFAAWAMPLSRFRPLPHLVLLAVGCYLLVEVARQPVLTGSGFVHLAIGWLVLWLSFSVASESARMGRALLAVVVVVGLVEAAYGLLQVVFGIGGERVASGTLRVSSHLAALLNMTSALLLGLLLAGRWPSVGETAADRRRRLLVAGACGACWLAVAGTTSRGGVLTLVATVLYLLALRWARRRRESASPSAPEPSRDRPTRAEEGARRRWARIAVVAGLLLTVAGPVVRAPSLALDPGNRPAIYRDTVTLIADNPMGVGPGMYRWALRPYQSSLPNKRFRHAHNHYLELAAEWGVPAAALLTLFLIVRCAASARLYLRSRDPSRRALALGASGAMLSLLLHGLVDFVFHVPAVLMAFALIVAYWWCEARRGNEISSEAL